ncbi:hypothetical protein M406DRAFT_69262 [Cryphonectria parasitica EP155]|uniref:Enoyl reductase (ER) domain-containing protein n=1 Tax=Cryphonectria parasitica (strain ATCC 38755 / EP155) TaxID=660469 RepID=A0A9P4Y5Y3_CRYP1|nr:uncharacterized protein M406DRAFT_69262 [Cryphonectria parasitica EP155]KAF3767096.1 hypothetical protein M406DRAFT_69262 [Cryphonectria parasitica EP155]
MKAWTYTHGGFPKALQQSELPSDVGQLKPSELRIRVKAASINPVDTQMMGFSFWTYLPTFIVRSHKGVAEDFSGVVEDAGKDAGFQAGDEVLGLAPFIPGGVLQDQIRIDTKTSLVVSKPSAWSWAEAAALPLVWLTAHTTVAEIEPYVKNGKVAVLGGSSSSGLYATYLAKQHGWTVMASCSGPKAELVRSMGASDTVDYTATSVSARLKEFAPDAIMDFVGGTECLGIAKRYVTVVGDKTNRMAMSGRAIYLWNPQMLVRALLGRAGLGRSYTCVNLAVKHSFLEDLVRLPRDKVIIDSTFTFLQVVEAFERLNTGRTRGKVVILMDV